MEESEIDTISLNDDVIDLTDDDLVNSLVDNEFIELKKQQPVTQSINSSTMVVQIKTAISECNDNLNVRECNENSASAQEIKNMSLNEDCKMLNETSNTCKYKRFPSTPSKLKLERTKYRAGVLYKKLTNLKSNKITSNYFNKVENVPRQWIPPRSPYALVQEDLFDKPWQLLVATIFLTKTAAKRALPQLHKFLAKYPKPEDVLQASYEDIGQYFEPIGLTTTRSHTIMKFTVDFLNKDWTYPRELFGIGKYGDDSYRMFCVNEWRQVSPDDIPLTMYRNWLLENAERLGIK